MKGSPLLWAAAVLAIGHAIQIGDGRMDQQALVWLAAGIALAWAGLFVPPRWPTATLVFCLLGLLALGHELSDLSPITAQHVSPSFSLYIAPAMTLLACAAVLVQSPIRMVLMSVLLLTYLAVAAWLMSQSAKPYLDVVELTRDSCQALAKGQDPYAITFPDIYLNWPEKDQAAYSPGVVQNGRVQFGYQYMPLSLGVAYAGHTIAGDFRIGNAVALVGAAALLFWAVPTPVGAAAAAFILFTQRSFLLLELGWTEPVSLFCLAAVVFCAARRPSWLPWAAGLFMASKQYVILASPALLLLLPRPLQWKSSLAWLAKAALAAAVVTLPMVLWNFATFWHSAVVELLHHPFRADSLNFAAEMTVKGYAPPPPWLAYAVAAVAAIIAIWRNWPLAAEPARDGRTPTPALPLSTGRGGSDVAAFAAVCAVIFLSFFALAKQAFGNYYFLAIGALCCAVAATHEQPANEQPRDPPARLSASPSRPAA